MSGAVASTAVEDFLDMALAGERARAVRLILDLLDDGVAVSRLIEEVLAVAQGRAGEHWQRYEWSVADEHLVSGVTQAALDALAATVDYDLVHGEVVVVCAEGDWHSLPSQLFAELLRAHGQGVVFLGASTPADDIARFVAQRRPDALAVSCSLPLNFLGVVRAVDAAHVHGVPAIAGGRALTRTRAAALGADAWSADVHGALAVLRSWRREPPQVDREPLSPDPAAMRLDAQAEELAERAYAELEQSYSPLGGYSERQRAHTREDLTYIVRYIAAARLVDDVTVFTDFREWLAEVLEARGVPSTALEAGLAALAAQLRDIDPDAHRLAATDTAAQQ